MRPVEPGSRDSPGTPPGGRAVQRLLNALHAPPSAPGAEAGARSGHQSFLEARYFPALDGLRAVSIVAVVWHHSAHRAGLLGRGYLGVELFFAISGFLITTLLLRERDRTGTVSLGGFYLRRALRIFPLYYAVLALYTGLVLLVERGSPAGRQFLDNLPAFLTYTSNWFVDLDSGTRVIFYFAWSLATEEQFYLFWPSVVRFARRWWTPAAFMAGLLLVDQAVELGLARDELDPGLLPVRAVASLSSAICLGCLAAYLVHRPRGFAVASCLAGRAWSAPLAIGLLLAAIALPAPVLVIHLAMVLLVVSVSIRSDHALRGLLSRRALLHVGTVSYGMYLLHMLAMNAARRLVGAQREALCFVVALGLGIATATLSYRLFERRFLALKERLGARPSEPRSSGP